MATSLAVTEERVTCPYDESHQVLKSKFSNHVVRCQLNYQKNNRGKEQKAVCSFNGTHQMNKKDLPSHEIRCPDRGNIIPHIAQHQDEEFKAKLQDRKTKSEQALKKVCWDDDNPEENWDEDSNHPTYVPSERSQGPSLAPAPVPVLQSRSAKQAIRLQIQQRQLRQYLNLCKNSLETIYEDDQA